MYILGKIFKMNLQRGEKWEKPVTELIECNRWGKPVKWKNDNVNLVFKLACLGALDKHIADFFQVELQTVNKWKKEHPDFFEALERGRAKANAKVAESLYLNCIDREVNVEEVHIYKGEVIKVQTKKFIQGDKWAQLKWLSLKAPELYSETLKGITNNTQNIINYNLKVLNFDELALMESIFKKQLPENAEHSSE